MAYATIDDIQDRLTRELSNDELIVCQSLLDDAGVLIDSYNSEASEAVRKMVSCRVVIRALGSEGGSGVPIGASQGSMSAMGYSQSWTLGSGAAVGELYLSKTDKQLLGGGGKVGSYSPIQELVCGEV